VELEDTDRDGDLDLWVSRGTLNGTGRTSQFWRNDGTGTFRLPKSGGAGESLDRTDTIFGDLDGDTDRDLVEGVNLGPEKARFNSGTGSFAPRKTGGLRDSTTDVTISITLFDADGDGDLDIIEANECPPPVCTDGGAQNTLWINNGQGTFTDETLPRLPARLDQTSGIIAGDIDGDGDKDLVVVNGSTAGAQSFILVNDGSGHFTDQTGLRLPAQLLSGRDGALVDIDGDGDRDLLIVVSRQRQSQLFLNNGLGFFTNVTANLPVQNASFQEVEVIDTNADGVVDFFYLSDTGATIDGINHIFAGAQNRLWENDGIGHFTDITAAHLPAVIDQSLSAAIGDVNGDGKFDIVVGNGKGEPIKLYLQQ
jgi:hypothetical protein